MLPPYLDGAIAAYRAGQAGRDIHLGYWDEPHDDFGAAQKALTRHMLRLAALAPGQSVLDVACGLGGTLAAAGPGLALTGLNLDPRQLRYCEGLGAALVAADACAMPFAPAVFDRVLCVEAMFHFASRAAFFAEASRVLKPGGVLAVCDILLQRPSRRLGADLRRDFGPWPELWIDRPTWLRHAASAGLELLAWEDWTVATLPSHRFTATGEQPGAASLRWLHEEGWLTYAAATVRQG